MGQQDYDLITIGGGPSGLMCAMTAVTGIPINPPRHFSGLVLDSHEIGQFAKYGKLRLTHQWSYHGGRLVQFLRKEAEASKLRMGEHERVVGADLSGEFKLVETTRNTYRARKVALCTGFFPHGHLMVFQKLVRVVFSPASLEARILPKERGASVAVLGGGRETLDFVQELRRARPGIDFHVVLEHGGGPEEFPAEEGLKFHFGSLEVLKEDRRRVFLQLLGRDGRKGTGMKSDFLLVDYNSYTLRTRVTDFLEGTGIDRKGGYIVADHRGRTGLPGVMAAGNIMTSVSGVLTALDTGFAAGLSVYEELHEEQFGTKPLVFPWLPRSGWNSHPLEDS